MPNWSGGMRLTANASTAMSIVAANKFIKNTNISSCSVPWARPASASRDRQSELQRYDPGLAPPEAVVAVAVDPRRPQRFRHPRQGEHTRETDRLQGHTALPQ